MQQIYKKCFFTTLQFSPKVKASLSQTNMMNSKIWNLVIRIPAVFFKTDYMQSPQENLNSAKFYHPNPTLFQTQCQENVMLFSEETQCWKC